MSQSNGNSNLSSDRHTQNAQLGEVRQQLESFEILTKNNPNLSPSLLIQNLHRILGNGPSTQAVEPHGKEMIKPRDFDTKWVHTEPEFERMNLHPELLRGLTAYGFAFPSLAQQRVIRPCISGWDVIAKVERSTVAGRTGAIIISVLQRINQNNPDCQAIILAKSVEAAEKIKGMALGLGIYMGISCQTLTPSSPLPSSNDDGDDETMEVTGELEKVAAQIIVGTPAQAAAALLNKKWINRDAIRILAIDDAGTLLDGDFKSQTFEVTQQLVSGHTQLILMSGTPYPKNILNEFSTIHKWNPVTVSINEEEVVKQEMTVKNLWEYYLPVEMEDMKLPALSELYEEFTVIKALVFCKSVEKVNWVVKTMKEKGHRVAAMHGELEPDDRQRILDAFEADSIPMLVTTDLVHGHGIELYKQHFSLIINYDCPAKAEIYIKRLSFGRRLARGGVAITFVTEKDRMAFKDIQLFLGIRVEKLPAGAAKLMEKI